jgi:hypothetical protein
MMTRQEKIAKGKLWQVYTNEKPNNILFEGCKTKCLTFIKDHFGIKMYKRGLVRIGQLIFEKL